MKNFHTTISTLFILLLTISSCDDFVKIDPPRTSLVKATVFQDDATANAAMSDVYYHLQSSSFASGSIFSISLLMSMASDEQISYVTGNPTAVEEFQQVNNNTLLADNSMVMLMWGDLYAAIYKCNAILEGVNASGNLTSEVKNQLLGEAKFIRAFCHFYLVNMWGDIPLVLTTDYRINSTIGRTDKATVYQSIVQDLLDAQQQLPQDYAFTANERVRANTWAATALLARAYLYMEDWSNAEIQSTSVIEQTTLFALRPNLSEVFNANNSEALLQWWSTVRPKERAVFRFVSTPSFGAIRPEFINGFEPGDLRRTTWTALTSAGYYRTQKYVSIADNPPTQYSTIIRLAELYLIRAEARAQLGNISEAQADIDVIRNRAGLANTISNDKPSLLLTIEQERRAEFFNEWGHRWFDLKRTGRVDALLSPIKPSWVSTAALFPIPESELINNSALKNQQNPGY